MKDSTIAQPVTQEEVWAAINARQARAEEVIEAQRRARIAAMAAGEGRAADQVLALILGGR